MTAAIAPHDLAPPISSLRVFARNRASLVGAAILGGLVVLALAGPLVAPFDPESTKAGVPMAAPDGTFWMGTDDLGRDIFSRVCFGIRTSLLIGLAAAAIATGSAVFVGALAGYFGGWIDDALMRGTEIFQVVPRFFLAILLVAFFGANVVILAYRNTLTALANRSCLTIPISFIPSK